MKQSEVFFEKSFQLEELDLSHSGLTINISSTWIPSFQLRKLLLKNCQIEGPIPSWISTQFNLLTLDLSANQLVGNLPSWLWDIEEVYLSDNHLQGSFTPTSGSLKYLDLSMNELSGHLPGDIDMLLSNAHVLILADNRFEGKIPTSIANLGYLAFLDMSNNHLIGNVPATLCNLTQLQALNLENNYLEGETPKELGSLSWLQSLRIGKNSLQGILPSSLANVSELQVFDVGENKLIGNISHWIANFSSLHVLVMRSNHFTGNLPPEIGPRMPRLQILDLSSNFFSGAIPHSYLRLPAMQNEFAYGKQLSILEGVILPELHRQYISYGALRSNPIPVRSQSALRYYSGGDPIYYREGIDLIIKGLELHYKYILSSLTCIDLSNNRLTGRLLPEIENLKGLMYLNLSRNNLSGPVPESLGALVQLESVDLSFNKFSGQIPSEIGSLTSLAHLNLSYNSLCGRIPEQGGQMSTFDKWSYVGNPNLLGCPLEKNCSRRDALASPPHAVGVEEEESEEVFEFVLYWGCFGLSVGVGFAWVVMMLVQKIRWRTKCFGVMDRVIEEMDRVICKMVKRKPKPVRG